MRSSVRRDTDSSPVTYLAFTRIIHVCELFFVSVANLSHVDFYFGPILPWSNIKLAFIIYRESVFRLAPKFTGDEQAFFTHSINVTIDKCSPSFGQ